MSMRTTFRMEDEYITMVRGDSLAFAMEVLGYAEDLDSAYFSVKNSWDDTEYVFQKTLGNGINKISDGYYSVRISPDDTKDVEIGQYFYDLRIGVGSDLFTVKRGILELVVNITEVE